MGFCPEVEWIGFGMAGKNVDVGQTMRTDGVSGWRELSGWPEPREMGGIGWKLRQCISFIERHHTREASQSGDSILTGVVNLCEKTKHRGFGRFIPKFDVVLRRIVQAPFGFGEVTLIEIALAELAVGDGEPFFVADRSMMIKGLFE